jgi:hypothetical protein
MFMKFAQFESKMAKARPEAPAAQGGGTDYGAMMAELFNKMAEKQFKAAEKKEPAKANKTITQG